MSEFYIGGGVFAGAVTLVLGWLFSGQIRKTDADKLWEEAERLRDTYKERIEEIETERDAYREERNAYRQEVANLKSRVATLETFQAVAIPVLRKAADGDPELAREIFTLGILNGGKP